MKDRIIDWIIDNIVIIYGILILLCLAGVIYGIISPNGFRAKG